MGRAAVGAGSPMVVGTLSSPMLVWGTRSALGEQLCAAPGIAAPCSDCCAPPWGNPECPSLTSGRRQRNRFAHPGHSALPNTLNHGKGGGIQ